MDSRTEWLPWYRRKDYVGNLTEEEKRYLDSFRGEEEHPAATLDSLPEEAQQYIGELELKLYDLKQSYSGANAIWLSCISFIVIYFTYQDNSGSMLGYLVGAAVFLLAWTIYAFKWRRNAETLWMDNEGQGAPFSRTEEALQRSWDFVEIMRYRKSRKGNLE